MVQYFTFVLEKRKRENCLEKGRYLCSPDFGSGPDSSDNAQAHMCYVILRRVCRLNGAFMYNRSIALVLLEQMKPGHCVQMRSGNVQRNEL